MAHKMKGCRRILSSTRFGVLHCTEAYPCSVGDLAWDTSMQVLVNMFAKWKWDTTVSAECCAGVSHTTSQEELQQLRNTPVVLHPTFVLHLETLQYN